MKPSPSRRPPQALRERSLSELRGVAWQLIDTAEMVVVDLDGCLAADNVPLPGAVQLASRLGRRLVVASNNSTHSAQELSSLLSERGLQIAADRFVLAGELTVQIVASRWPGARVMLLGTPTLSRLAESSGLRLVSEGADLVVLTRAITSGFAQLEAALSALHGGADLVVANPDLSHPGAGGAPRLETGALHVMLKTVLPDLRAVVIGKPEAPMFDAALALGPVLPDRAVMIGDNQKTDIEGAMRIGMNTIHLVRGAPLRSAEARSALAI